MKKFLLFVTTVFLSLFLINNKTYAQAQEYPDYIRKVEYDNVIDFQENENTYEYLVSYFYPAISFPDGLEVNEYFMITFHNILLSKGLNRNTNSYVLEDVYFNTLRGGSIINIRVTLLKSFVNDNYPDDISSFFIENSALYVIFTPIDYSEVYNEGYDDGYDDGYNDGYNIGYNEGKNDGYNEGYDEGYNEGYEDGRIIIVGRAPDNDYNFNNFGEPIIDTAYANRLYYSTGLGRVPVISKELFVGYNNTMIDTFYGVFFYDSTGNNIGDIIINCGNTSSCENTEGYGEKFNYMANSIDFAYNFAVYLDKYDIDYENVEFVELQFITKNFPTAGWHEHFKNDLYFSFNYEHSFLRINLYQQGYNDGFEEGEEVGRGIATREAYELGYETGYKDALKDANVDNFIANLDKWIVPAIIIVIVAGIFVGYRRERYSGD